MVEARYFCPNCGSIDLRVKAGDIITVKGSSTATCELCGWEGPLKDTTGAATTETFYDIEKIADILLRVVSKHAAGPLSQAFQLVGLLEPGDQEGLNKIMKAAFTGLIEGAFGAASEHASSKPQKEPD